MRTPQHQRLEVTTMQDLIDQTMRTAAKSASSRWADVLGYHEPNEESDALAAYEMCEEFREYLIAYLDWQKAHAAYCTTKTDASYNALMAAQGYKDALLQIARNTPEHKAAFGY
jgi:hypothetical protein